MLNLSEKKKKKLQKFELKKCYDKITIGSMYSGAFEKKKNLIEVIGPKKAQFNVFRVIFRYCDIIYAFANRQNFFGRTSPRLCSHGSPGGWIKVYFIQNLQINTLGSFT